MSMIYGAAIAAAGAALSYKANVDAERMRQERALAASAARQEYAYKEIEIFGLASTQSKVSKCNCCGSLDFVKHHSNIICSYCRTPNHVR